MTPETEACRRVDLFRAEHFPRDWSYVATLIDDFPAVDPTIVEWKQKLWLFCTATGDFGSPNEDLYLFFADSLLGPWKPHPLNPVVMDVRSARPAGTPFVQSGDLIRPGQDCSRTYGGAIVLNRVEVMDDQRYREVAVSRVEPDWMPGIVATHTLAVDEHYVAVDGRRPARMGVRLPRKWRRARA